MNEASPGRRKDGGVPRPRGPPTFVCSQHGGVRSGTEPGRGGRAAEACSSELGMPAEPMQCMPKLSPASRRARWTRMKVVAVVVHGWSIVVLSPHCTFPPPCRTSPGEEPRLPARQWPGTPSWSVFGPGARRLPGTPPWGPRCSGAGPPGIPAPPPRPPPGLAAPAEGRGGPLARADETDTAASAGWGEDWDPWRSPAACTPVRTTDGTSPAKATEARRSPPRDRRSRTPPRQVPRAREKRPSTPAEPGDPPPPAHALTDRRAPRPPSPPPSPRRSAPRAKGRA